MARFQRLATALLLAIGLLLGSAPARAIDIDPEGTISVNLRAYANARIGTVAKQSTRLTDFSSAGVPQSFGGTYPYVGAGNLIQNRYFLEVKWKQDLLAAAEKYADMTIPDDLTTLGYTLIYRGEYDGIYDFGPSAFRKGGESLQEIQAAALRGGATAAPLLDNAGFTNYRNRHRLRQVAPYKNRLFQVYLDFEYGPVFLRVGRQTLAWGETDVFRILDNINPVDNFFGSFLIELDERRVPLNMIRGSYFFGSVGPIEQAFLEGYIAYDNTVAYVPGAARGSAWAPPLGPPTGRLLNDLQAPCVCGDNLRGGGRFVANVADFTFTLASYVTIFDTQQVRFRPALPTDAGFIGPGGLAGGSAFTAVQTGPRVWVNGASVTTALPSLKSVLRSEFAWFRDEALFRGPTASAFPLGPADALNPNGNSLTPEYLNGFVLPILTGQNGGFDTVSRKDTLNFAIGWDTNQYIRFLNPDQTFFVSTQFFVRSILNKDPLQSVPVPLPNNETRVVSLPTTAFLHTLLINTTYNTKIPWTDFNVQTTPGLSMFYDWQGMFLFQPSLRFVRDPWRFVVDYSSINSGVFKYQIGLLRDKSNVRFQVEYVL